MGLYVPNSGGIFLNGIPLQDFAKEDLAKNIGYVSQNIRLFYASIRDNLCMFDHSIKDSEIEKALKETGMLEKITSLPGGLDYICKDEGENFSSGEMQLLACTRLFLKKSKIIILDESTARLDPFEEERISKAFKKTHCGKNCNFNCPQNRNFKRYGHSSIA